MRHKASLGQMRSSDIKSGCQSGALDNFRRVASHQSFKISAGSDNLILIEGLV